MTVRHPPIAITHSLVPFADFSRRAPSDPPRRGSNQHPFAAITPTRVVAPRGIFLLRKQKARW